MITTKTTNICFWGNNEFFNRTQELRKKIKAETSFTVKEELFSKRIHDCAMFISCPEPNSKHIQEGFVKVVYAHKKHREYMNPILIDEELDIYHGGTTISMYRPTLEQDLWNVIMEFQE